MSGDPIARTATMARILNISAVHLGRIAKEPDFPGPISRGRWDVVQTVRAYITLIEKKATQIEGGVKSEELLLITARRVKTEAEAASQEMKNSVTMGNLLHRRDVDAAVIGAFSRVRARVLGLPSKVAATVVGIESISEVEAKISGAVDECLRELSETTVADLCGDGGELVEDSDAAAEIDGQRVGGQKPQAKP